MLQTIRFVLHQRFFYVVNKMRGKMRSKKRAIIIGGGPAGLTAAIHLLDDGTNKPIVFEEQGRIGGISATIEYNGNRMDLGGHRFFSKSDEVMNWWTSKLPLSEKPDIDTNSQVMLLRKRVSRIFYLRKFFDYPISIKWKTFANMGLKRTVSGGVGYISAKLFQRTENNLEDFMINRFGAPLYHMFFEDYTKKVWGKHPRDLSPEWGAQRIKGLSLFRVMVQAVKNIWKRPSDITQKDMETSLIEQFMYPTFGPGQLWETVATEILERGGEIHLNTRVDKILFYDGKPYAVEVVTGTGERMTIEGDVVFSSMPIKDLVVAATGISVPKNVAALAAALPYRDFITVGLLVDKIKLKDENAKNDSLIPDCWIYIQEKDVQIGRLQIFNNWSPYMVKDPEKTVWMGLEYFCNEGDELWNLADTDFIALAIREMVKLGIIDNESVLDATRIKVKKAYPGYFGAYDHFTQIRDWLDDIPRLYCMGRNGLHRYNNMDHSMLTAKEAVRLFLEGNSDKSSIWAVNSEESYHEVKMEPVK
jgi:protoporphyrinogen oxidase